jgi:hypothetical protein
METTFGLPDSLSENQFHFSPSSGRINVTLPLSFSSSAVPSSLLFILLFYGCEKDVEEAVAVAEAPFAEEERKKWSERVAKCAHF